MSIFDFRVEEEWSPGEIVVDRCYVGDSVKAFGLRSEPRQSGSTTLGPKAVQKGAKQIEITLRASAESAARLLDAQLRVGYKSGRKRLTPWRRPFMTSGVPARTA